MKKIICFVLAVVMCMTIGLAGCGNQPTDEADLQQKIDEVQEQTDNVNTVETGGNTSKTTAETIKFYTYKVPMKDIYIDAPNYQEIEQAFTELFIVHESRYVAITAAWRSEAEDCKDAHDKAFDEFKINMQNYEGGVNSLNILNDSNATINGIEVYRFEGTLNYGRDTKYDGYAVGYSFIMDGIPCEIIGSVIDDSQSDALKTEIASIVEAMIKSVRSEAKYTEKEYMLE